MLISFFTGPVLQRYGYRKVAVFGAIFISLGLMMTASSSNFWLFIFSYSIICSLGVASVMASFSLAINSFFKEKRARAVGAGMSMTGLGAIYMPLLMSTLMYAYGWRFAVLILSAICLHSLVAACLLRPAKWYLINPPVTEEMEPLNKENGIELVNGSFTESSKLTGSTTLKVEESVEIDLSPLKSISMRSLNSNASLQSRNAISHPDVRKKQHLEPSLSEAKYKWWESQEINLGSSINIFNEPKSEIKEKETAQPEKAKKEKTFLDKIIKIFDLTLLSDPIFVNILIGLSVASCVETNFSLLLPMILKDMMGFETFSIAQIMAVIGFSDTIFRFVSPFIGEWCNKPARVMYIIGLLLIIFTRTIMLFTTTYIGMMFVALLMGITKGVRTVYMNVIIPSYVPIDRLPFAYSIQMFVNGITIIALGPLLGKIRELSGSYQIPIVVLNLVTVITIILWCCEFIYFRLKQKPITENQETK
ncbi:uncharacterized protein LOC128669312 isoform X2 [Plodia interpunctella]|nr:uncharacterized protein LOC128669312 isoform X2 [Plodia interpunctella]